MKRRRGRSEKDASLLIYLVVAALAVLALLAGFARESASPVAPGDRPVARAVDGQVPAPRPVQRAPREISTEPFRPRG